VRPAVAGRKGNESVCWRVAAKFENVGSLTEVAMFHRSSRTLLLTDAVVFVPQDAPEIVPRPQLSTAGALPWCVLRCPHSVSVLISICVPPVFSTGC
jgi:Domain of unknown function (DUF4336)